MRSYLALSLHICTCITRALHRAPLPVPEVRIPGPSVGIIITLFTRTVRSHCTLRYVELELSSEQYPPTNQELWGVNQHCCAGTVLGQEAYKLVLTDIFFTLMAETAVSIGQAKLFAKDGKIEMSLVLFLLSCLWGGAYCVLKGLSYQ
jgi:hypothetical protein